MHLFYKKKKPKYLNLYFGFFFSLPPAVSIRIPLLSMLMTRCRAMQPKHNCALQASLHALLCFVCAPFSFLSLSLAVSIRIPLLSMLMARCRAMQPKHKLCFASKLARTVMLRLRTARRDLQIVSYIGLHRSHFGLTVCYDFPVL